ncbi:hypothetical protein [Sphingobium yanoikuyae]|uniref:hypothetical protein n=1 Tax=Sphingobium yanoikuyae TaxID=13690 RepID=UPI0028ABB53D|nr:hypothetical protein [Sphingobium yanoikuyae]
MNRLRFQYGGNCELFQAGIPTKIGGANGSYAKARRYAAANPESSSFERQSSNSCPSGPSNEKLVTERPRRVGCTAMQELSPQEASNVRSKIC